MMGQLTCTIVCIRVHGGDNESGNEVTETLLRSVLETAPNVVAYQLGIGKDLLQFV